MGNSNFDSARGSMKKYPGPEGSINYDVKIRLPIYQRFLT
jgi:hypothetical protein